MELIVISYITDLIFGDPQWFPHPVRLMAKLISFFDRIFNNYGHKAARYFYGAITAFSVIAISGICADTIIGLAEKLHPTAGKAAWVFLAYTTLAVRDLIGHAYAVRKQLLTDNIEKAREKLSLMVGRDTKELSQDEIIRAAVETVAESTTDGIIAPLFYLFLGGPVLAVMFKAISTLDSMIAHKNERYCYFGWCAAKLDTIANFIPARITGLLIPAAALFCGKDFVQSFWIMLRDGGKQDSLNSAVSEAAMSGALGIQLGGVRSYKGREVKHPYLGEQKKPMSIYFIEEAVILSVVVSLLMIVSGIFLKKQLIYG